jgi:hypothetical protein
LHLISLPVLRGRKEIPFQSGCHRCPMGACVCGVICVMCDVSLVAREGVGWRAASDELQRKLSVSREGKREGNTEPVH